MRNIYRTYREHYKALFFLGLPIVIGQIGGEKTALPE